MKWRGAILGMGWTTLVFLSSSLAARPVCEDVLVNGSFERPVLRLSFDDQLSAVQGWRLDRGQSFEIQRATSGPAADGAQYIELASRERLTVSQTVGTSPGERYRLQFSHSPRPGNHDNAFAVRWNGAVVARFDRSGKKKTSTNWRTDEVIVEAKGGTATVTFQDLSSPRNAGSLIDRVRLCRLGKEIEVRTHLDARYECGRGAADRADATLAIEGGRPPYRCSAQPPALVERIAADRCAAVLPVGSHTIRVRDAAGSSKEVVVNVPAPVTVRFTGVRAPTCCTCRDGAATVVVDGQNPPFNWRWSDANDQRASTVDDLPAGVHRVLAANAAGCYVTAEVRVPAPPGC